MDWSIFLKSVLFKKLPSCPTVMVQQTHTGYKIGTVLNYHLLQLILAMLQKLLLGPSRPITTEIK